MMRVLCLGEILLRLSPPQEQRLVQATAFEGHYGGSEANVAVSLAQWGLNATFACRVPDNDLGRAAIAALQQYGVDVRHVLLGGERLGLYFLEQGAGHRPSKVLYDRTHSSMATLQPGMFAWPTLLDGVQWLHWSGITPALSASAAEALAEGIREAHQRNITVSCDLNYRANLWQYGVSPADIMPALVSPCSVLLGDTSAFRRCLNLPLEAGMPPEEVLPRVKEAFPHLHSIAMTRREGISASHHTYQGFLWSHGRVYASRCYDMPDLLDRIGGGDALMAGLIFGLSTSPHSPQENIEWAIAAGVWKHYVRGDFNLCSVEEVRALMNGRSGARILR